jgi:hypothetical protein
MFTNIDFELYPDLCEVAHMPLHSQWVYMIQKNGTSSIREHGQTKFEILVNEQIRSLEFVDIYIRNPKERYISGVNTFVQYALRDHPDLDRDTIVWAATRYLFLNRHYLPQLLWVVNLSKYLSPDTILRFHDFRNYGNIIDLDHDARITPASQEFKEKILSQNNNLDFWFFADQILLDLAGSQLCWNDVKSFYQERYPDIWKSLTKTARSFQHVLS